MPAARTRGFVRVAKGFSLYKAISAARFTVHNTAGLSAMKVLATLLLTCITFAWATDACAGSDETLLIQQLGENSGLKSNAGRRVS